MHFRICYLDWRLFRFRKMKLGFSRLHALKQWLYPLYIYILPLSIHVHPVGSSIFIHLTLVFDCGISGIPLSHYPSHKIPFKNRWISRNVWSPWNFPWFSMVFHGFSPCFYSSQSSPVGPSPYREGPQLFSAKPEVATSSISSDTSSAVLEGQGWIWSKFGWYGI